MAVTLFDVTPVVIYTEGVEGERENKWTKCGRNAMMEAREGGRG